MGGVSREVATPAKGLMGRGVIYGVCLQRQPKQKLDSSISMPVLSNLSTAIIQSIKGRNDVLLQKCNLSESNMAGFFKNYH